MLKSIESKKENEEEIKTGFNFELCKRNLMLQKTGLSMPITRKTGTTICGIIFKDGVILGADTRATEGPIVADQNCFKIHFMSPNIYCCGAGTAADTQNATGKDHPFT
jgi:20S proteasome subunit beta 2